MCGIVGYTGTKQAAPILVDGLHRLEYRGYDSAGIAVHDGRSIEIVRAAGKLQKLADRLAERPLGGVAGIGHTRWATHGRPSEINAHPHAAGPVAIVHNGIIENHVPLRRELAALGVVLRSDTDTEIVAHLIHRELQAGAPSLFEAVRRALRRVTGSYAIAAISRDEPGVVVAARDGSPLVLGKGDGEMLCGSDVPALLPRTRDMIFLEDGDLAELYAGGYRVEAVRGGAVERRVKHIDWSLAQAEKGGFKHFMLKEIHEQPEAIEATLRGRIDPAGGDVHAEALGLGRDLARSIRRVCLIACGTSHHAGMVGRYWIERLARVPATVELASEVRHRKPVLGADDLVVAISQSGETIDTLFAARAAKEAGARVLAVSNVVDSAIPRLSDGALYTHAGPEIGVASTKCFTAQLAALLLLAVCLGKQREALLAEQAGEVLHALRQIPGQMRQVLGGAKGLYPIARWLSGAKDVLYLGRDLSFPVALEGALKLKEISYMHAEGYAAGEMKHGPIALIDGSVPVVVVAPRGSLRDTTLSNMQEVRAREGRILAIATRGDDAVAELAEHVVWLPEASEEVAPFLAVLPLQLLAYEVADLLGHDVDQPRNLAKTVTVE
jgi:glucosamine--fructose-6-phosphate aminotransferase (isomerizing)